MGAQAAKATRTAQLAGKTVISNEALKEVIAPAAVVTGVLGAVYWLAKLGMVASLSLRAEHAVSELHQKSPQLVGSVSELSEGVEYRVRPEPQWPDHNFKLFKAMQRVRSRSRLLLLCFCMLVIALTLFLLYEVFFRIHACRKHQNSTRRRCCLEPRP